MRNICDILAKSILHEDEVLETRVLSPNLNAILLKDTESIWYHI